MPVSTYGVGTDPTWIGIFETIRYLPLVALIFLAIRVFIATPLRIKLNHYPRFFNLATIAIALFFLYTLASGSYQSSLKELKALEAWHKAHPVQTKTSTVTGEVLDLKTDQGDFYLLVDEDGRRVLLKVTESLWESVAPSDTVVVRMERRVNPAAKEQTDKNWTIKSVARERKARHPQFSYDQKRQTRWANVKLLRPLIGERGNYCLLLEAKNGARFVQEVRKELWLAGRAGDKMVFRYKRVNRQHWRLDKAYREVK
jgi:hypothetical protein